MSQSVKDALNDAETLKRVSGRKRAALLHVEAMGDTALANLDETRADGSADGAYAAAAWAARMAFRAVPELRG